MNEIQRDLPEKHYTRNKSEVELLFRSSSVDLEEIILNSLRTRGGYWEKNPFVIADLGCGSGTAIEQYAQMLMTEEWVPRNSLKTIGVDSCLMTDLIPEDVLRTNSEICKDKFLSQFVEHDLEKGVPLESNSVDVIYAAELINYITDSLKFLEEVYRCLQANGVAVIRTAPWAIAVSEDPEYDESSLSFRSYKAFIDIAAQYIPYADRIFRVVYDEKFSGGIIIMKKIPELDAISFGCQVHRIIPGNELSIGSESVIKHIRSAVYRTFNGEVIPIVKNHDIPVTYLVDCPL